MTQKILRTRNCDTWLDEDGILMQQFDEGAEVTADDIRELNRAHREHWGERRVLILTDISKMKSISREARDWAARARVAETTRPLAVVASSTMGRVMGTFFERVTDPPYPTRVFLSRSEAIEWLKSFGPE